LLTHYSVNGDRENVSDSLKTILDIRKSLKDRVLAETSFLVSAKDDDGKEGTVSFKGAFLGTRDGHNTVMEGNCLFQVEWKDGKRVIEIIDCVIVSNTV
jgi:hypothetical protein